MVPSLWALDRTGFLVGGKGPPEHGKAVGQDQGFAQALQESANDERGETRRETNRGRAQAIESDPREEDPLLSEPVTQSVGTTTRLKRLDTAPEGACRLDTAPEGACRS